MSEQYREYDWIEFVPRPKKDGLHDSGYRYIKGYGVRYERGKAEGEPCRDPLWEWADHVDFRCPTNWDVTAEGVIRAMPRGAAFRVYGDWWGSDGEVHSSAPEVVANYILRDAEIMRKVYEK